jgi:PhnB protein
LLDTAISSSSCVINFVSQAIPPAIACCFRTIVAIPWIVEQPVSNEESAMSRKDQFVPHLVVSDGMTALTFYQEVFAAVLGDVMMEPGGRRLMHGEIILDDHMLFLSDEFAEKEDVTTRTPKTLGGTTVRITVQVSDANATVERAVARGVSVLMPVQDMFWGARYGQFVDPFGHEWGVNQQITEQTAEETSAAAEEFFANRQQS